MAQGVRRTYHLERVDVILAWPKGCDYPIWRQFIRAERERFSRVLAVLTGHDGDDLSAWLRIHCPEVEFVESRGDGWDWRDAAVNTALDMSFAERVWFTEQDFFITDQSFWDVSGPVVGFNAGDNRPLHPACIFADRELVDRTSRYFGSEPIDHFYTFGTELCEQVKPTLLTAGFRHLQGTTHNHWLLDRSETGIFRINQFRDYLTQSLAATVPLEDGWVRRARTNLTVLEQLAA